MDIKSYSGFQQVRPAKVQPLADFFLVILKKDMTVGGTADAHPYKWSTDDGEYQKDKDTTVTVEDTMRACAGSDGDLMIVRKRPTGGEADYEAWENLSSIEATAILCADLATDDPSVLVKEILPEDGKFDTYGDAEHSDTAYNAFFWIGSEDAKVRLRWSYAARHWEITLVELDTRSFPAELQADNIGYHLDRKNRVVVGWFGAKDESWTHWADGTTCTASTH